MRAEDNFKHEPWRMLIEGVNIFLTIEKEGARQIAANSLTNEQLGALALSLTQAAHLEMSDEFREFYAQRYQRISVKVDGKSAEHTLFLDAGKLGGSTLIALSGQQLRHELSGGHYAKHKVLADALGEHYSRALIKVWRLAKELHTVLPEHEMSEAAFGTYVISTLQEVAASMSKGALTGARLHRF